MKRRCLLALLFVAALAGCGAAPQAPGAQTGSTAPAARSTSEVAATGAAATPAAEASVVAAATPAAGPADGAVPAEFVAAMATELAARLGVAPELISVVSAEAVTWSDGSLGCPQPGMMYPQVMTEGVRVILAADGVEYAYHGDDRGRFFFCESPQR